MLAVFVNMATVLLGSCIGIACKNKLKPEYVSNIVSALALVTLVIGILSAVETQDILCFIVSMALGTALGTALSLEHRIDQAGEWVKHKVLGGRNASGRFAEGFVSACILFCVGSMTIMGSFAAGIEQDYSIIFAKSALDFVFAMMFGAAMGLGVTFSIFFILFFQGGLTLLANAVSPYLSTDVVVEMSAVGGAILIGLGFNLLELSEKKIKVADMLSAIFLPVAYLPLSQWIIGLG